MRSPVMHLDAFLLTGPEGVPVRDQGAAIVWIEKWGEKLIFARSTRKYTEAVPLWTRRKHTSLLKHWLRPSGG